MSISPALAVLFAVVMGCLAAYDSVRLALSSAIDRDGTRPRLTAAAHTQKDVDLFHALMGAAMVTMLLGHLSPFVTDLLAIVFGCYSCWFITRIPWEVAGGGTASAARMHWVSHSTAGAAMVYMLIAMPESAGRGAMSVMTANGSAYRLPLLGVGIACVLIFEGALHLRQLMAQIAQRRSAVSSAPLVANSQTGETVVHADASGHVSVATLERVRLTTASSILVRGGSFLLCNELSETCQITMSVVMAVLLIAH
jgi:hypothetical protein